MVEKVRHPFPKIPSGTELLPAVDPFFETAIPYYFVSLSKKARLKSDSFFGGLFRSIMNSR
jgi:hypothetical protein